MSKTIPCRFEFKEKKSWAARVCDDDGKILFRDPPPPRKMHGIESAELALMKSVLPRYGKSIQNQEQPSTFEKFKQRAIERFQMMAVDSASVDAVIFAPTNYLSEFWTHEHVTLLARALNRQRSKNELLTLKGWLVFYWEKDGLCDLTQTELADKVNSELKTSFKPATIAQTARRLNLFTKRDPGPKKRPIPHN